MTLVLTSCQCNTPCQGLLRALALVGLHNFAAATSLDSLPQSSWCQPRLNGPDSVSESDRTAAADSWNVWNILVVQSRMTNVLTALRRASSTGTEQSFQVTRIFAGESITWPWPGPHMI